MAFNNIFLRSASLKKVFFWSTTILIAVDLAQVVLVTGKSPSQSPEGLWRVGVPLYHDLAWLRPVEEDILQAQLLREYRMLHEVTESAMIACLPGLLCAQGTITTWEYQTLRMRY